MAILLIRHGETASNAARIVQTPDTPLSERGLDQARRLGKRLASLGVARIVSSDLRRAAMTAEAIASATGLPLELEPLLQERNFGDVRGTPYSALTTNIFDPAYQPPGGEDGPTFERRVDAAWERIARLAAGTEGRLAVVTHGLVCRSVIGRHASLSGTALPEQWPNTSLSILDPLPPHVVRLLNCVAHLDGEDRPAGGAV